MVIGSGKMERTKQKEIAVLLISMPILLFLLTWTANTPTMQIYSPITGAVVGAESLELEAFTFCWITFPFVDYCSNDILFAGVGLALMAIGTIWIVRIYRKEGEENGGNRK